MSWEYTGTRQHQTRRQARVKSRCRDDVDQVPNVHIFDIPDPGTELPGTIYAVPDRWWGFHAVGREDHPGACIHCSVE